MFQDLYGKDKEVNTINSYNWQEISINFSPIVSSQNTI